MNEEKAIDFSFESFFFSFQINKRDSLPKHLCSECWSNVQNFHKFYLSVNSAKDNYLSKCMESGSPICGDSSEIVTSEAVIDPCKAEPLETIECDENPLSIDNASENCVNFSFGSECFAPDATIEKRDFDAIFFEEFTADCEVKTEQAAPMEVFTTQSAALENIAPGTSTIAPSSSNTAEHKPPETRKRVADSSNADLVTECSETVLRRRKMSSHGRSYHQTTQ